MTVEEALGVADSTFNQLYRAGYSDPAVIREAALDVLAEEVRRLQADLHGLHQMLDRASQAQGTWRREPPTAFRLHFAEADDVHS